MRSALQRSRNVPPALQRVADDGDAADRSRLRAARQSGGRAGRLRRPLDRLQERPVSTNVTGVTGRCTRAIAILLSRRWVYRPVTPVTYGVIRWRRGRQMPDTRSSGCRVDATRRGVSARAGRKASMLIYALDRARVVACATIYPVISAPFSSSAPTVTGHSRPGRGAVATTVRGTALAVVVGAPGRSAGRSRASDDVHDAGRERGVGAAAGALREEAQVASIGGHPGAAVRRRSRSAVDAAGGTPRATAPVLPPSEGAAARDHVGAGGADHATPATAASARSECSRPEAGRGGAVSARPQSARSRPAHLRPLGGHVEREP